MIPVYDELSGLGNVGVIVGVIMLLAILCLWTGLWNIRNERSGIASIYFMLGLGLFGIELVMLS